MEKAARSLVEMEGSVEQLSKLKKRKFGIAIVRLLCHIMLETGREYKREKIIQLIYDYYTKMLGGNVERKKVALAIKSFVKDRDYFERLEYYQGDRGYYRYIGPANTNYFTIAYLELERDGGSASINDLNPEHEYGSGKAEVYAWCLPRYQKTPDGNGRYPITIGYAGSEGFVRRNTNIIRNLPEKPVYLLRLRCLDESTAKDIADYLHLSLKMENKQITNADGQKWFQTNWEEIEKFINNVPITNLISHKKQN